MTQLVTNHKNNREGDVMHYKRTIYRPVGSTQLSLDERIEDLDYDWKYKARALQVRRWRELKREMKSNKRN